MAWLLAGGPEGSLACPKGGEHDYQVTYDDYLVIQKVCTRCGEGLTRRKLPR